MPRTGGQAQIQSLRQFAGNAAGLLAAGLNVNALRTNNVLRKEEWVELDQRVVEIARAQLVGIEDLRTRGLTLELGGLGTLYSQYEAQSDMTPATINMTAVNPADRDRLEFELRTVPVPVTFKEFNLDIRVLEASRRLGNSLDYSQGVVAARRVADGLEGMLFRGATITVDGNPIYGYTTHPHRNTGAATGPWNVLANIYPTVLNMIRDMDAVHMRGPYVLYVAGNVWPDLLQIYEDGSGQTARTRILENIPALGDIKTSYELLPGEAVLVQMAVETVDLAIAQDIATVEWESRGGWLTHFMVLGVMVPRIKSDHSGRCGIVHYSGLHVDDEGYSS